MATKQAIVSQNDYGIAVKIGIVDGEGNLYKNWNIEDVNVIVITPSGVQTPVSDVTIIGGGGECKGVMAVLNAEHTQEVGNHALYVRIKQSSLMATTVNAWNYYVLSEFGL